jgi:hypothetical protein
MLRLAWTSRWNVLRLVVAAFLLWAVVVDAGPRLARLQLAALPGFDHAGEVARLREEGRFGEALMIADAGLAEPAPAGDAARARLVEERQKVVDEQASWLRAAKDVGWGALTGQGDSIEGLLGAVTADLFIFGDVRDLAIQGTNYVTGRETDLVLVALSTAGIVTTVAPVTELGVTIAKAARRVGGLSVRMGEKLVGLVRAGRREAVLAFAGDVGRLAEKASPGGALRLLRHADDAEDLARMTRLAQKPGGAAALHVTGDAGVRFLRKHEAGEAIVIAAGRKGAAGRAFLDTPAAAALLRAHPLLGVAKGVYKGNAERLAARMAEWLDPRAWWILPGLAAWVVVEVGMLAGRAVRQRGRRTDALAGASGAGAAAPV